MIHHAAGLLFVAAFASAAGSAGALSVDADMGLQSVQSVAVEARGDARTVTDGAMAAGSAVLVSPSAEFDPADVGKLVYVMGAGEGGAPLSTTIQDFASTDRVTLARSADIAVSRSRVTFGTDDASAIQAAIDRVPAEGGTVSIPSGSYLLGSPLTIVDRSNVALTGEGGPTLLQHSLGADVLTIRSSRGIEVSGIRFGGIPGDVSSSGNSGIDVTASEGVRILRNTFTGLRYEAVFVKRSRDVVVADNLIHGVSNGLLFRGCDQLAVERNTVRHPQVPPSTFVIALFLDSTDGHGDGINRDVTISDNVVTGYVNGQAIELHAGAHVSVTGNVLDDVLIGVSLNPYNATDTLTDVTVAENVYRGTSTPGAAPTTGNYGIFVGGGGGAYTPSGVTIARNTIANANAVVRGASQGGIGIGVAERATIVGNSIRSSYGSGIVINHAPASVEVTDNLIHDIRSSGAPTPNERYGIFVSTSGNMGRIARNEIVGVDEGVRLGRGNPDLIVQDNRIDAFR
jgi:hypothetical protein